nr:formyltransferase family protein [Sneathiella glossodoripedis]
MRVAVLISSRGSNMQALVNACKTEGFPAEIACVLSNNPDAAGLDFAKANNIPTKVIDHREFEEREEFDAALSDYLASEKIDLICLAGFMRLLSAEFVNAGAIVLSTSIHPFCLHLKDFTSMREPLSQAPNLQDVLCIL